MSILDLSLIKRVRQSHALEHATIHILSRKCHRPRLIARSHWSGFVIYGDVGTDLVMVAAREALERLQAGEYELAIHPRCGTNLATGGLLAGAASVFALSVRCRSNWYRFWGAVGATLGALILARPLGLAVQQRVTTCPDLRSVRIEEIQPMQRGSVLAHRVKLGRV